MGSRNSTVDQAQNNRLGCCLSPVQKLSFDAPTLTVSASTTTANRSLMNDVPRDSNKNELGDKDTKRCSKKVNIKTSCVPNADSDTQILPIYSVDTHSICNSDFSLNKSISAQSLLHSQSIRYADNLDNGNTTELPAKESENTNGHSSYRLWSNDKKEARRSTVNSELIDNLIDIPLPHSKAQNYSESDISCDSIHFHDISEYSQLSSHKNSRCHSRMSSKVISGKISLINNSSMPILSAEINPLNDDSDLSCYSMSSNTNASDLNADKKHTSNVSLTFPSEKISKIFNYKPSLPVKKPSNINNPFDTSRMEQKFTGIASHDTCISLSTSPTTVLSPNINQNDIESTESQEHYSKFPRELTTLVPIKQIPPTLISSGMVVHDKGIIDEFGEISEFKSPSIHGFSEEKTNEKTLGRSIGKGYTNDKYRRPTPVQKTRSVQLLEKYSKFSLDNCKAEQDFQLHQWESFFMSVALRRYPNFKKITLKPLNEERKNDEFNNYAVYTQENHPENLRPKFAKSERDSNIKNEKVLGRTVCENADYSLFSNYGVLIGPNACMLTKEELKVLKSLLVAKYKKLGKISGKSNATSKMVNFLSLNTNSGKSFNDSTNLLSTEEVSNQKWYTFGIPMKLRAKIWLAIAGISLENRSQEYAELINGKYLEDKSITDEERQSLSRLMKINERQIGLDYGRTMGNNVYFHNICERKERYLGIDLPNQTKKIVESENSLSIDKNGFNKIEDEAALSPGSERLRDLLTAFARKYPKLGYCQGMNIIAANLILVFLDQSESYLFFEDLIIHRLNTRVFSIDMSVIQKYVSLLLNKFMKKMTPKIYNALSACGIDLQIYFVNWYITLFENIFPNKILFQVWDYLFCYPEANQQKNYRPIEQEVLHEGVLSTDLKFFKIIITVFAYFERTLSIEELSDVEQMNMFLVRIKGYIVAQNFTSIKFWELHQKLFKSSNDLVNRDVLEKYLEY